MNRKQITTIASNQTNRGFASEVLIGNRDGGRVAFDLSPNVYSDITPDQARAIGQALIAAADAAPLTRHGFTHGEEVYTFPYAGPVSGLITRATVIIDGAVPADRIGVQFEDGSMGRRKPSEVYRLT